MGLYEYLGEDTSLKHAIENIQNEADKLNFIDVFANYSEVGKRKEAMNGILKDVKCAYCGGSLVYSDGSIKGKYIKHKGSSSIECEKKVKKNVITQVSDVEINSANAMYNFDDCIGDEKKFLRKALHKYFDLGSKSKEHMIAIKNLDVVTHINDHRYINESDLFQIAEESQTNDIYKLGKILKVKTTNTILALKLRSVKAGISDTDSTKVYFYLSTKHLYPEKGVIIYSKFLDLKDVTHNKKYVEYLTMERIALNLDSKESKYTYYLSLELGQNFNGLSKKTNLKEDKLIIYPKTFEVCIIRVENNTNKKEIFYTVGEFLSSLLI